MKKEHDYVPYTEAETKLLNKLYEKRVSTEARYPLVTALAATFGFVSVLYGFEKMIDSVDFLANNPVLLLVIGLIILTVTGTVYKKLN